MTSYCAWPRSFAASRSGRRSCRPRKSCASTRWTGVCSSSSGSSRCTEAWRRPCHSRGRCERDPGAGTRHPFECRYRLLHAEPLYTDMAAPFQKARNARMLRYAAKLGVMALKARELLYGREYPVTREELRARLTDRDDLAVLDVVENWADVKAQYEEDRTPLALLLDRFARNWCRNWRSDTRETPLHRHCLRRPRRRHPPALAQAAGAVDAAGRPHRGERRPGAGGPPRDPRGDGRRRRGDSVGRAAAFRPTRSNCPRRTRSSSRTSRGPVLPGKDTSTSTSSTSAAR